VRILGTKRERFIATLLLALGIPCSAQLGIIMAMLGAVSLKALLLVFLVVLSQLFLVGYLAARILPGQSSDFLIEIPPVRIPKIVNICVKTYSRVKWFLVEAVPVFLFGTCILFVLDKLGVIARIERAVRPVVVGFLGLPAQATESFLIGFFRRDFGAAGLFSLQKAGALSNIQVVVSMVVITLFVPCLASLIVIFKEQGVRKGLAIVGFVFPFAILVGGILNFVLRYFKCAL
jgi:ferrous iron transport protein B